MEALQLILDCFAIETHSYIINKVNPECWIGIFKTFSTSLNQTHWTTWIQKQTQQKQLQKNPLLNKSQKFLDRLFRL